MNKKFKTIKLQILNDEDKVVGTIGFNFELIKHLKEMHDIDALNLTLTLLMDEIERICNKK